MKATAWAPANIAFIKYWGKQDAGLRLPLNPSLSMNLDSTYTTTTVEFSPGYREDSVQILNENFSESEKIKVSKHLDLIRHQAGISDRAKIVTQNTFPKGAGAAASASGFAALTVAASAACRLSLSQKDLTILARIGSGSACRSIPDGFVIWETGDTSSNSYAYSLYPHTYWDLCDVLVIVDSAMKKVPTTVGMEGVTTSPFLAARLAAIPDRLMLIKQALQRKDFPALGALIEEDCLDMHRVMQTQRPPLMYWNSLTQELIRMIPEWRQTGVAVYFTIDAGPNVHLICQRQDQQAVMDRVSTIAGVTSVIKNTVCAGTRLLNTHLF
jgi:diphosphomevalonate decarboxylase